MKLKLSEAIRKGSKGLVHCQGGFFLYNASDKVIGVCALGAAALAIDEEAYRLGAPFDFIRERFPEVSRAQLNLIMRLNDLILLSLPEIIRVVEGWERENEMVERLEPEKTLVEEGELVCA